VVEPLGPGGGDHGVVESLLVSRVRHRLLQRCLVLLTRPARFQNPRGALHERALGGTMALAVPLEKVGE